MIRAMVLLLMLCSQAAVAAGAADLRLFSFDSYQGMVTAHRQESFLMVLWSLDCPPCVEELHMLGRFHQQYPDKKIILISTDSAHQRDDILGLLRQSGLQQVEHWVFHGAATHLRYAIDPGWYGELPRSYFHGDGQPRRAFSGRLQYEQLVAWFAIGKDS